MVSVESIFGLNAPLVNRIIAMGGMKTRGYISQYVNLYVGNKVVAQLHRYRDGVALALRSGESAPETFFDRVSVVSLSGYERRNIQWLEGTHFDKKPAIAFSIPNNAMQRDDASPEWQEISRFLAHAKKLIQ